MNARRRTDAAAAAGIHVFVPGEGENGAGFYRGGLAQLTPFFRTRFLWDSGEKLDRRLHTGFGRGTMRVALKIGLHGPN